MKDESLYIGHIIDALEKIEKYLEGATEQGFLEEGMLFDAVCRELGIVGEAANKLSDVFKEEHADIPWRKIIGLRNVLIHEYFGISASFLWKLCQQELPQLKVSLLPFRPQVEE